MEDIRVRLSVLWLFATLNYIYADVFFCIDVRSATDTLLQMLTVTSGVFGRNLIVKATALGLWMPI
jgi:hypothetical protein